MPQNSAKYQYFSTLYVNIVSVGYGATCGWPSPSVLLLMSNESPLIKISGKITEEEGSWITSVLCIGGLIGNLFFGWLSDKIGRKSTMLLVAIPQLISWAVILVARNPFHLCISQFLGGIAGGGAFVVIPLYVTETSEDRVRGSLGSCLVLSCNVGILLSFVLGNYLNFYIVPCVLMSLPIVFLIGFPFLPETPKYLMKSQKEKDAEKSLKYFRNIKTSQELTEDFEMEMIKLRNEFGECQSLDLEIQVTSADFTTPVAIKAFIIGLALLGLNQFCGCFAMINYTALMFQKFGSNISPNMSAIVVGIIQLLGSYLSTILVERAGRKLLLVTSAIGTGLGLVCLGVHELLKGYTFYIVNFGWLPVASFSFIVFIASIGILTLPFVVLSEIMPPKIRSAGTTACMIILWIISFFMVKYLPSLEGLLGLHGCMFTFASCSFAGAIF